MRVRRARTSCDTSLTILALSLGDRVVNHFARRCIKFSSVSGVVDGRGSSKATNHFALAGQQNQVSGQLSAARQGGTCP